MWQGPRPLRHRAAPDAAGAPDAAEFQKSPDASADFKKSADASGVFISHRAIFNLTAGAPDASGAAPEAHRARPTRRAHRPMRAKSQSPNNPNGNSP
jgi:hypothetical protein